MGAAALAEPDRNRLRTYRGYRLDICEEPEGGWSIVIYPPVGLPGRIEALRDPDPEGLQRLLALAEAHVDEAMIAA